MRRNRVGLIVGCMVQVLESMQVPGGERRFKASSWCSVHVRPSGTSRLVNSSVFYCFNCQQIRMRILIWPDVDGRATCR